MLFLISINIIFSIIVCFIANKVRLPVYKYCNIPATKKIALQTYIEFFLLQLLILKFSYDTYLIGEVCDAITSDIFSLSFSIAGLYSIWFFINKKLSVGSDLIFITMLSFSLHLFVSCIPISTDFYFEAFCFASQMTYAGFISLFSVEFSIVGLTYYLIPDSKAIILQLWNGDEKKERR